MAERIVDEHRTGWIARLDDVERTRYAQGWCAKAFQMAGDQTHGLMAYRSHGYQIGDIDPLAAEALLNFGDELLAYSAL